MISIKNFLLLLSLLLFSGFRHAAAQACLPEGITFSTQGAIDSFFVLYPGCTTIEGSVEISGPDITNLDGLGGVSVIENNLLISGNTSLTSLAGLDILSHVGGGLVLLDNDGMANLNGLNNLQSVGELNILFNDVLVALSGLENIDSIAGGLTISENLALSSLAGLDGLQVVGGSPSLGPASRLEIKNNASLTTLEGLDSLSFVGGSLSIQNNPALASISSLMNITAIGRSLTILDNPQLATLEGLGNVAIIGDGLTISGNENLGSLEALQNLSELGASFTDIAPLTITENPSLVSLEGLDSLDESTVTKLIVRNCPQLSACEVESVCNYLMMGGLASISDNEQGCNTVSEVEEACQTTQTKGLDTAPVVVFPNPASGLVYLKGLPDLFKWKLTLRNSLGMVVGRPSLENGDPLDLSSMPAGIYFLELENNGQRFLMRILKR